MKFRKNVINRFYEIMHFLISGPKMYHSLKSVPFTYLFNACHWVELQKTLMNRFGEKIKSVNFGPKNDQFTPFSTHVSVSRTLTSCKLKKVIIQSWENGYYRQTDALTDGWMDRQTNRWIELDSKNLPAEPEFQ